MIRTYCFPGVLRGHPEPRLATTPTNRPRRSLSSPGMYAFPSIETEEHRKTRSVSVVTAATISVVTEPEGQLWSGSVQTPPAPHESAPLPHVPDQPPEWPPAQQSRQSWIKRRLGPVLAAIAAFFAK